MAESRERAGMEAEILAGLQRERAGGRLAGLCDGVMGGWAEVCLSLKSAITSFILLLCDRALITRKSLL